MVNNNIKIERKGNYQKGLVLSPDKQLKYMKYDLEEYIAEMTLINDIIGTTNQVLQLSMHTYSLMHPYTVGFVIS